MNSTENKKLSTPESSDEKDLLNILGENLFSRSLFVRSLWLASLTLGLRKIGYAGKQSPSQVMEKWRGQSTLLSSLKHYYAHDAVLDKYNVIAPWYKQLNGQCDFRIRIAAETMKRYPWTTKQNAEVEYPDYLFTSNWSISQDGQITPKHLGDWPNGDMGQRAICVLEGMTDYYRYSGDAAAIAHITYMGDYILDYTLTPADHPWPGFPISVPVKGKPYGKADPRGMIQIDISASMGESLLRAYQITKKQRWFDAAKHWGDLIVAHCDTKTDGPPWPRYANPENCIWPDHPRMNLQTGSVVMILTFLEELMRMGYSGGNGEIVKAREAGVRYLRDKLLPLWWVDKTLGCYFWDWIHDMQESAVTTYVANYLMKHPDDFPNWKNDVRNVLTLFLNRACTDPVSGGDVFNGAWAYPESSMCCQRSLWYAPLGLAASMLKYGSLAADAHMRELGYRQMVLQTYDAHDTGVSEDVIDGGINVNNDWLAIAVPWPLQAVQHSLAWLPEELGASRENHIVRSTAVVDSIVYAKGRISYSTYDAPAGTVEVLRLSFTPSKILAGGLKLALKKELDGNGYTVKKLPNGDTIVSVRHDGLKDVVIEGKDPQKQLNHSALRYEGDWKIEKSSALGQGSVRSTDKKNATVSFEFTGNQVRVIGRADEYGGCADVYLDGKKQLVFIDCWNPSLRDQHLLYYRNGLENKKHTLKIVARGNGNPYAKSANIYISAIQYSSAYGAHHFPSGTGPVTAQRMILGYTKREEYRDSQGRMWRAANEVVTRLGKRQDVVAECWMKETSNAISNTADPELYRYGFRAHDFWINLTVGPGRYGLRLMFAMTREEADYMTGVDILINGTTAVKNFNLPGTAKEFNRAVSLVFRDIAPVEGIIQVRLKGNDELKTKAFLQALEIDPHLTVDGDSPATYKNT